jgi:hypothetical protein
MAAPLYELVEAAAFALSRTLDAREILQREGLTIGARPHPGIKIEADSVALFARLLRQLNFEE